MRPFLWTHLGELGVVEEVGPVAVDESAEGKAVPPAQVEVLDVHVLVGRRLALAPQQQALLRRHLLHRDVLDGEPDQRGTITCHTVQRVFNYIDDQCCGSGSRIRDPMSFLTPGSVRDPGWVKNQRSGSYLQELRKTTLSS
jgi:hypothetical protein